MTSRIIPFRTPVEGQHTAPDPAAILDGAPKLTVWNHYSDSTQQFFCGVWGATRGRWRVRYTEHEFCHILAGRVAVTGEDGERQEFGTGDSFVVPAGFHGTWEVLEDCRKLYAIFEPRADVSTDPQSGALAGPQV